MRDPRDCVLSTQEAWGNTPLRTAQEWADRVRRCRTAGTTLGPSRYHELRYEDLVGDVRGRLAATFDFLGVPTPADAGEFLRVPENLGSARGAGRGHDRRAAEVEAAHVARDAPSHRGGGGRPARRVRLRARVSPTSGRAACPPRR